jgi:hypothetical protein
MDGLPHPSSVLCQRVGKSPVGRTLPSDAFARTPSGSFHSGTLCGLCEFSAPFVVKLLPSGCPLKPAFGLSENQIRIRAPLHLFRNGPVRPERRHPEDPRFRQRGEGSGV